MPKWNDLFPNRSQAIHQPADVGESWFLAPPDADDEPYPHLLRAASHSLVDAAGWRATKAAAAGDFAELTFDLGFHEVRREDACFMPHPSQPLRAWAGPHADQHLRCRFEERDQGVTL